MSERAREPARETGVAPLRGLPSTRRPSDPASTPPVPPGLATTAYDALDDPTLVGLLSSQDGAAMETLWARYSRPCLGLARRLLGDDHFAQDAVQEVFLALWRRPSAYDPARGGFATWLLSMTHHKAVDAIRREENLRKRRTGPDALIDLESDAPPVEDTAWVSVRRDRVRAALADLPPVQRQALGLAYFGGYTQSEIAGLTGTPLGTVKTRMLAGMRRLRGALDGLQADAALDAS